MKKIIGDLKNKGLYKKDLAPYRRGCIQPHESIIGPWEKWYDLERDYRPEQGHKGIKGDRNSLATNIYSPGGLFSFEYSDYRVEGGCFIIVF